MALGDWLKKLTTGPDRFSAKSPSPEYPAARHAIEAGIAHHLQSEPDGWVSIYSRDERGKLVLHMQIADRSINLLLKEVNMPGILAQGGLADLASRVVRKDPKLHELRGATTAELAVAAECVLASVFGIGAEHSVEVHVED